MRKGGEGEIKKEKQNSQSWFIHEITKLEFANINAKERKRETASN